MRRRPLARAAVLGGTAYVANKAGQASANNANAETDQEARLEALEAQQAAPQQAYAPPAPPAYSAPTAPAAPAAGGDDIVAQLTSLKSLLDAGALTPAEFEVAKQKLLAG